VFNKREVVFYQTVQKVEGAARDLLYSDKTRASSLLNIFKNNTYNTIYRLIQLLLNLSVCLYTCLVALC
jgi:hypothetical protein